MQVEEFHHRIRTRQTPRPQREGAESRRQQVAWRSRPHGKSPSRSAVLTLSVCQDRLQGVFKPQSVSGTGSPLTRMLPARGAQFQTTAPDTDIPNFPLCLAQKRGLGKAPGFPLFLSGSERPENFHCTAFVCQPRDPAKLPPSAG